MPLSRAPAQHEQRFPLIQGHKATGRDLDIQSFILDRQAQGMSTGTLRYYRDKLKLLNNYLSERGIAEAGSVSPVMMLAYIVSVRETHNPGGTLLAYRAAATFFKWLVEEGSIPTNPMERMKPPRVPARLLEPVTADTVKALVTTCGKDLIGRRDRAMLLSLLDSGCRASEFVALNVGDVGMSSGAVAVRHAKGRKARVAFLGTKTRRELHRYLSSRGHSVPEAPLWLARNGKRLGVSGLAQTLVRRAAKAGVEAPSPHAFRRAFALASLRGGMDIYSLQKLMGHADLTVLRRYLAQTQDDLQEAHRKAGPVDRLL